MRTMESPAPSTYTPEALPETYNAPSAETETATPERPQTGQEYVQMQYDRIKDVLKVIHEATGREYTEEGLENIAKTILMKAALAALVENLRPAAPETGQPATGEVMQATPPLSLEQIAANRTAAEQRKDARHMLAEQQRHNLAMLIEQRRHNEAVLAEMRNRSEYPAESLAPQQETSTSSFATAETNPAETSEYDPEDENEDEENEPYSGEIAHFKEREAAARARIAARKAERREKRGEVRAELYDKAKGHAKRIGKAALRGIGRFAKRAKNAVAAGAGTIRSR